MAPLLKVLPNLAVNVLSSASKLSYHPYLVLKENTIVQYKCTNYYDPFSEYGIKWNDEDLNISWGISDPIVSDKDEQLPKLKDQNNLPIY